MAVPDAAALDPAGKFNAGALVRATLLDRYTAHKLGIEAGWLLRSEVRELEDRPPHPGHRRPATTRSRCRMTVQTREFALELEVRAEGRVLEGTVVPYGEEARIGPRWSRSGGRARSPAPTRATCRCWPYRWSRCHCPLGHATRAHLHNREPSIYI